MYLVKIPTFIRKIYSKRLWKINTKEKIIYITFDDGPNPGTTEFILQSLRQYNAKATFFCIGKNVLNYPELYKKLIENGHLIGNHTHNHLNGWKTSTEAYINNIATAFQSIKSDYFRPPYGRMTQNEEHLLHEKYPNLKIVMWHLISGDFDRNISPEKCWKNINGRIENGSIIVFHDSDKAEPRMRFALLQLLEKYSKLGFQFKTLKN